MTRVVDGFELLPLTTIVSLLAMLTFLTARGWWRYVLMPAAPRYSG